MPRVSLPLLLGSASLAVLSTALFRAALDGRSLWLGGLVPSMRAGLPLLLQPIFLLGAVAFVGANLLWLQVISSQRLSVAYPAQLGLVISLNAVVSALYFGDALSRQGWVGVLLVVGGVALLFR